MMFKIGKIQLLVWGILISMCLFPSVKVKAEENKALVIYDTYNEFGSEENKLNSLVNLILSTQNGVDIINVKSYLENPSVKYETLFVMYNNAEELPKDFIQDLLKFNGKIVWIGKNFNEILQHSENVKYVADFSSKDESYSILKKEIYELLNKKQWKDKNVYLLIDKIYPFIDLNSFMEKVDFLHDQGISFVCSVMPVYENVDFDAMKRFCEVLRYAQSKGGKIIIHSSVLYGDNIPGKDVKDKMGLAEQIYIKYGVYPLAMDIPEGFLYKEDYKDLIHSSNSIFIEKDNQIGILDFKKCSISRFDKVIDKIDFKDESFYKNTENNHNIAFDFNSDLGVNEFKSGVIGIINKGIYFSNAEHLDTLIKLGKMELSCNNSNISLNNKVVDKGAFDSKSSSVAKDKSKTIDIGSANGGIIKVTIVICFIFIIIVLISTRIDRKKFFK